MIARLWHGWTRPREGDAYEALLRTEVFPALSARVPGFRGGYLLRRHEAGEDEFVLVNLFDSIEAVHTFAGDDHERPVIEPEAARLLLRGDERALHYEVAILSGCATG